MLHGFKKMAVMSEGHLAMVPRPHPKMNENQHQRVAQHIGSPRRGAPGSYFTGKIFHKLGAFVQHRVCDTTLAQFTDNLLKR